MVTIRGMSQSDLPAILDLVSELADWFDEDARQRSMPIDLRHQDGLVAVDGNQVLGFLTWYVAEGRANIGWLAVDRAWRRRGIGRSLVDALTVHVKPTGIQEIANLSMRMNERMENIGARRLHTVMTTLLEEVLFDLPEVEDKKFVFDAPDVTKRLLRIVEDEDLRKYIL